MVLGMQAPLDLEILKMRRRLFLAGLHVDRAVLIERDLRVLNERSLFSRVEEDDALGDSLLQNADPRSSQLILFTFKPTPHADHGCKPLVATLQQND